MNLYQPTITGSLSVSGSVNISGSITIAGGGTISGTASIATTALTASSLNPIQNSYVILSQVSASLNFADDDAAATGGVPLGGLYRNGNFILIRVGGSINYTIGQAALGGIIAYINGGGSTGTSGLVATAADISSGALWGCLGTEIAGADSTAIGTGNQNTIDIMAGCATAGIAARLCGDLTEGGYSDWYLPSKDELTQLYINKVAIGGFTNNRYWSSTESDANLAWIQNFNDGFQPSVSSKSNTLYVRAIRSF
jgi:hypothetical protein